MRDIDSRGRHTISIGACRASRAAPAMMDMHTLVQNMVLLFCHTKPVQHVLTASLGKTGTPLLALKQQMEIG